MSVFPKEQILVLRMEDYHQDIAATMTSVYAHLGLRGLNANEERQMNMVPVQNKNRKKMNIGKILNSTEDILRKFYEEYNKDLADLLGDLRFTWDDYYNMA
ncbi:hypothetical protein SK128_000255 [Halocaridina rubra]|uniref:Sulfotransferase n=1 Tax=Halocaridina rubra TaxID=373956 RepID=A0AAN8XKB4_HALRR